MLSKIYCKLADGSMSPRMGSKQEPDYSISLPPDCDIKYLAWGYIGVLGIYRGFKIADSKGRTIACKTWGQNDFKEEEFSWQATKLAYGEKLVGFFGNLS